METESNNTFTVLNDASHVWPFYKLLSKIPLNPNVTYFLVSFSFYLIFLIFALFSKMFEDIFYSSFHVLQIFCSISIFAALSLGRLSANRVERAYRNSKIYFEIEDANFEKIYKFIQNNSGNLKSQLISLPLIILFVILFILIGQSIPNSFFPTSQFSLLYIFVAYLEISIFMIYLLCSVGLWCLLVITIAFRKLEKCELKLSALKRSSNLYELPKSVFNGTLLQLFVYCLIVPLIFYIVVQYDTNDLILWIGIIGTAIAYLVLLILIYSTQYSIYKLLVKAKNRRLDEVGDTFSKIQSRIESYPDDFPKGNKGFEELRELVSLNSYLLKVYENTNKNTKVWLIDLMGIGRLIASGLVPLVSIASMIAALF